MDAQASSHSWDLTRASLAFTWLLTSTAIIAVFTRLYLRRRFFGRWASHDWIMLAALAFQFTFQVVFTAMCRWGSGRPSAELTETAVNTINRLGWILAPLTHPTSVLARISIAILLVRIFGTKTWFKIYTITCTTLISLLGFVVLVLNVAQVQPYQALWDYSITDVKFWNPKIYQWTASILQFLFALWDVTLVLLPVIILWSLNMRTHRKVGLIILLGFSLVTAAAAIAKGVISVLYTIGAPLSFDDLRGTHIIDFTTCLEQALVIVIGCVPSLRSITQLKLPTMTSISSSLTGLISKARTSSRGSDTEKRSFSRRRGYSSFEDLELTPRLPVVGGSASTKDGSSSGPVVTSLGGSKTQIEPTGGQVHRVDSYSVSYQDRELQRTGV